MADVFVPAIRSAWSRNGAYGLRLVADVGADQMLAQPVPGRIINHPGWILCHLNVYAALIGPTLRGEAVVDPIGQAHSRGSRVTLDPADYPERDAIVSEYSRLHDAAAAALDCADETVLAKPNPIGRMRAISPRVSDLLMTLMVKHESFHLGQLSAWRRAMGLPGVEM